MWWGWKSEALVLGLKLRFQLREQVAEERGRFSSGCHGGIIIHQRGQRALRRNVVVRQNRADAANGTHARVTIREMNLLRQSEAEAEAEQELLVRIGAANS